MHDKGVHEEPPPGHAVQAIRTTRNRSQARVAGAHLSTALSQATQAAPFVAQVWSVNSVRQVSPAQQPLLQFAASQPVLEQAAASIVTRASATASVQRVMQYLPGLPGR